jgi:hypothetical protein
LEDFVSGGLPGLIEALRELMHAAGNTAQRSAEMFRVAEEPTLQ